MAATLAFVALLSAGPAAWTAAAQEPERPRIVVVAHGAPGSGPFWAEVEAGAKRAAEATGADMEFRAPPAFDMEAMTALIEAAIAEKPDGLALSIPDADALAAPLQAAVKAGIPVVTFNSGYDIARSLGAALHVGQGEYEAGRAAGEEMLAQGARSALCLNHEQGNVALDLRCKGFIDGFGGSVEVVQISGDMKAVTEALTERLTDNKGVDAMLALSAADTGEAAVAAARTLPEGRAMHIATFDVTETMLRAIANGSAAFAVDQQPFLQGYLPVMFLALRATDGVMPVSNVSTGPRLVDAAEAAARLGIELPAEAPAEPPAAAEAADGAPVEGAPAEEPTATPPG
jgi:simple sugar transport system substrate-binding protein